MKEQKVVRSPDSIFVYLTDEIFAENETIEQFRQIT